MNTLVLMLVIAFGGHNIEPDAHEIVAQQLYESWYTSQFNVLLHGHMASEYASAQDTWRIAGIMFTTIGTAVILIVKCRRFQVVLVGFVVIICAVVSIISNSNRYETHIALQNRWREVAYEFKRLELEYETGSNHPTAYYVESIKALHTQMLEIENTEPPLTDRDRVLMTEVQKELNESIEEPAKNNNN